MCCRLCNCTRSSVHEPACPAAVWQQRLGAGSVARCRWQACPRVDFRSGPVLTNGDDVLEGFEQGSGVTGFGLCTHQPPLVVTNPHASYYSKILLARSSRPPREARAGGSFCPGHAGKHQRCVRSPMLALAVRLPPYPTAAVAAICMYVGQGSGCCGSGAGAPERLSRFPLCPQHTGCPLPGRRNQSRPEPALMRMPLPVPAPATTPSAQHSAAQHAHPKHGSSSGKQPA